MEAPFSDKEKRFVLSEAIKTSSVPVDKLLAFILEGDVEPTWNEVLMPFGRNLNSCINVWESLRAGSFSSSLPVPTPERKRKSAPDSLETFQAAPQPKRRQSGADTMIRIQPKPSSNGSPLSFSTPATQPKKRGRPSKAEVEARNAAAIARGEVIPPPRINTPKESIGGEASTEATIGSAGFGGLVAIAPMATSRSLAEPQMSTSFQSGSSDAEAGDVASDKKRVRPGYKPTKESKPGQGSFSSFAPPSVQLEMPQPPATKPPAAKLSEAPALAPKPKEGGISAPVYPGIDSLLSPAPEPYRPGRSDA